MMNKKVEIPIDVRSSADVVEETPVVADAESAVSDEGGSAGIGPGAGGAPMPPEPRRVAPRSKPEEAEAAENEELEVWRDRALRLQAEMENFRKRQQRRAEERIQANRERLLRRFLRVADDLERALNNAGDAEGLREGIEMTHRSLMRLLDQEGVEQIEPRGQSFDPLWHEAVGTVSHQEAEVEIDTVVDVAQEGYRLDGRLLRPARVVVAT